MTNDAPVQSLSWLQRHRFFGLVIAAVIIALFLVAISLNLYSNSGAAQLDLSRPGYQSVRKDVLQDKDTKSYPSTGAFDKNAFDQFVELYDQRSKSVQTEAAFDPAALGDESLQLLGQPVEGAPDAAEVQPPIR